MRKIFYKHSKKPSGGKRSGLMVKFLLSLFIICVSFSTIQAQELTLTGTPTGGKSLILTVPAKIMQITRTQGVKSYTIWLNNSPYVTINRFNENNRVKGVLPPGEYALKTLGGSVTIYLNTVFPPENIILWGRQNAIVQPLLDGNFVVLSAPTAIAEATYDGTKGMSISGGLNGNRVFHYLSPHNIQNPGPKVFNAQGTNLGKTLVNQVLPPGVYRLVPERLYPESSVYGQIVLKVAGSVPSPLPLPFTDDLNSGFFNWDTSNITLEFSNEKIVWNTANFLSVFLKHSIPMENIAIEFDGYAEDNGINVFWSTEEVGYLVTFGGWYNTKSCSDIGGNTENREFIEGPVWTPKKWHHYKIIRQGDYLSAYCDNKLIFQRTSSRKFEGSGQLKFNSFGSKIGIDNVKIYRVSPVVPPEASFSLPFIDNFNQGLNNWDVSNFLFYVRSMTNQAKQ
ncbi:MAG: hypothetical protein WAV32_08175 [Halobacteriota archaeon]